MKLILSIICFALAGLTYSFIPPSIVYPTYPIINEVTAIPLLLPTLTPSPIPTVQAMIVELVYPTDTPIIQPANDVLQAVVVPKVLVQEIVVTPETQISNYDPSLYDEWQPYTEPIREEAVNVWDLDNLWDAIPVVGAGLPPCPDPLPTPFVTWDMAQRAAALQSDRQDFEQIRIQASVISQIMAEGGGYFPDTGNIRMPENDVIYMLMASGANVCQNGSTTLYGNGVQSFLDSLYNNYVERN
jgi:hypothetical protein